MLGHLIRKSALLVVILLAIAGAGAWWASTEYLAASHLRDNGEAVAATVSDKRFVERQVTSRRGTRTEIDYILSYDFTLGPDDAPRFERVDRYVSQELYDATQVGEQAKVLVNPDNIEEIDFGTGETARRARNVALGSAFFVLLAGLVVWAAVGPARRDDRLDRLGQPVTAEITGSKVNQGYVTLDVRYAHPNGTVVDGKLRPIHRKKLGTLLDDGVVEILVDPENPTNIRKA